MDDVAAPQASDIASHQDAERLSHARLSLGEEVARLDRELAQAREDRGCARRDAQAQALRQAEELGGLRDRATQADQRAERLEAELQTLRCGPSLADEARWTAELDQLRAEIDELRATQAAMAQAVSDLRRRHTAALVGLVRPGPVQGAPPEITGVRAQDYLTLSRSALMDVQWYRLHYKDVAESGADPVSHYLEHGWREGRRPGPLFDGASYLAANPDLAARGVNPLVHYQTEGAFELRPTTPADGAAVAAHARVGAPRRFNPLRIVSDLRSYEELQAFRRARPDAFADSTETAVIASALTLGIRTEFLGELGPEHVQMGSGDTRECLMSGGLNSRTRAIADLLLEELREAGKDAEEARIYGHEAVTYLATLMRRRFPGFLGTEYAPDDEAKRRLLPFVHNDICASQFPDESFDATFSCDVFEHVYDRDAALRETARTTVPGGVFLATFPFHFDMAVGHVFAELVDGELVHHLDTPIFHGNPVDEEGGSLVFEIPGWDIVERARRAGFSRAAMRFVCDEEKGVTASGEGRPDGPRGVFVLVAHR